MIYFIIVYIFAALGGARLVELSAGDALVVPRGWWHYVQNVDDVNITLNIWLPHVSIFLFIV